MFQQFQASPGRTIVSHVPIPASTLGNCSMFLFIKHAVVLSKPCSFQAKMKAFHPQGWPAPNRFIPSSIFISFFFLRAHLSPSHLFAPSAPSLAPSVLNSETGTYSVALDDRPWNAPPHPPGLQWNQMTRRKKMSTDSWLKNRFAFRASDTNSVALADKPPRLLPSRISWWIGLRCCFCSDFMRIKSTSPIRSALEAPDSEDKTLIHSFWSARTVQILH